MKIEDVLIEVATLHEFEIMFREIHYYMCFKNKNGSFVKVEFLNLTQFDISAFNVDVVKELPLLDFKVSEGSLVMNFKVDELQVCTFLLHYDGFKVENFDASLIPNLGQGIKMDVIAEEGLHDAFFEGMSLNFSKRLLAFTYVLPTSNPVDHYYLVHLKEVSNLQFDNLYGEEKHDFFDFNVYGFTHNDKSFKLDVTTAIFYFDCEDFEKFYKGSVVW